MREKKLPKNDENSAILAVMIRKFNRSIPNYKLLNFVSKYLKNLNSQLLYYILYNNVPSTA